MAVRRALRNTMGWVLLALAFNVGVYYYQGQQKALEFLTGYLIELSLSVDNIFVFILIFTYFKVDAKEQKKILFWGILGAQLMRLIFIFAGVALLSKFSWIMYIFGSFLVFTGLKLFFEKDKDADPQKNIAIRLIQKCFPNLSRFWLVLLAIEFTDLVFAVDSVPAVLAVTKDPFIVYTSNIFAILGLRSMYFALSGVMGMFHLLHYALGAILVFVGSKMLLEHYIHIPIYLTLSFIIGTLATAIIASLILKDKKKHIN